MFCLDMRLPVAVRDDLVRRVNALPQFAHLVLDSGAQSLRVTENEWKNDFEVAAYLEMGSLK